MGMASMNMAVEVLSPSGILDSTQAAAIGIQVDEALKTGAKTLLVDLKETTFVDSSGLGTLVSMLKKTREQGCDMAVCSINPQVKMLFELTSMDQVFSIFENREAFEASRPG